MTRKLVLALTAVLLVASVATAGEIELSLAAMRGSQASFTQKFTPKGFTRPQVESGTVVFGNFPQMRWEYRSPEQKLFVFDGRTSWLYSPADRQATRSDINDEAKRALPFLLIGDPVAVRNDFKVSEVASGAQRIVTLEPKSATSTIARVVVTTAAKSHLIQRLEYSDRQGNRTSFELTNVRKASPTDASFRFTPPAGVEIIEN
jgi:outer membrane lipoprotein carrier protein